MRVRAHTKACRWRVAGVARRELSYDYGYMWPGGLTILGTSFQGDLRCSPSGKFREIAPCGADFTGMLVAYRYYRVSSRIRRTSGFAYGSHASSVQYRDESAACISTSTALIQFPWMACRRLRRDLVPADEVCLYMMMYSVPASPSCL